MVRLPGTIDVAASLEIFRRNGDDYIDRWDGVHLVRGLRLRDRWTAYACRITGTLEEPALAVTVRDSSERQAVEGVLRSTFVVPPPDYPDLLRRDRVVANLESRFPGLRPVLQFDLLAALVRCISSQQVNLRWAATTRRRLAERFGDRQQLGDLFVYSLSPERLAGASVEEIRALQFTTRKAEYLIATAETIAGGRLKLAELTELPDEEVISRLTPLRGIGLWTAEWILARTLGRPRVVAGDLGVRKAVGLAYLGNPRPTEQQVRETTAHWGASAGVAQQLLLQGLVSGRRDPDLPG